MDFPRSNMLSVSKQNRRQCLYDIITLLVKVIIFNGKHINVEIYRNTSFDIFLTANTSKVYMFGTLKRKQQ